MTFKITLGKSERMNVYRAESDILLDGHRVGTVEITYAYSQENKLRIKEYSVKVYKAWVWETLIGSTTRSCKGTVTHSFRVDGTWETKASKGGFPFSNSRPYPAKYETFTNGYTSARSAKATAMAFITDEIKVGIFQ